MTNTYQITTTLIDIIEFTDEEMLEAGYELPITEEDREEYLDNLLEEISSEHASCYDIEIKKIRREDYA